MAEKRKKEPTYVTPKGVAKYARLNRPSDMFKKEGEYDVTLILSPEDPAVKNLMKLLDDAQKQAVVNAKADPRHAKIAKQLKVSQFHPYKNEVDEAGNETGNIQIKFKATASGTRKKDGTPWKFKPALFDAKGHPLPEGVVIWGGSLVKVAFQLREYVTPASKEAGVSLKLQSVQVIELKTGSGRDAASFGFKEEEGYEAPSSEGGDEDASGGGSGGGDDAPASGEDF